MPGQSVLQRHIVDEGQLLQANFLLQSSLNISQMARSQRFAQRSGRRGSALRRHGGGRTGRKSAALLRHSQV